MSTASNVTRLHPDSDSELLPEPFLPPDVDLAGFSYLPLPPDRLQNSPEWRRGKREPFFGFRFVTLLMATFRQSPAGSLPDDDQALADILGMDDERWAEIKASTMEGWTLCSDGRWHHPLAKHCVGIAWEKHRANSKRTEAAIAARVAKRGGQRDDDRHVNVTSHQGDDREESKESIEGNEPKESLAPAAAAPTRSRGTRIPDNWSPDRAYAKSKGLDDHRIDVEAEKFRAHWQASSLPSAVKRDWSAAWRTWVMNVLDGFGSRSAPPRQNRDGSARHPDDL